jgi:AAA domain-containing protein
MSISFGRAIRTNVNLLIGVAGASGSGKTYSALRLASGISDGSPFAVIDTERGRSKHYADMFTFDVAELEPPFSPARYLEAIEAADKAGYPCIVVDSASHSWAGEGGCMDMQEDEFARLTKGKEERADAFKLLSWAMPKQEHKRMLYGLLKVRAHVILCFRAEPKVEIKKEGGKAVIVPKTTLTSADGWIPICEKSLPFELTASALLMPDYPGVPKWIKLQEQHRVMFPPETLLDENAGKSIAAWARGAEQRSNGVRVEEWEALLKEAPDANQLAALWKDCYAACLKAKDKPASARLLAVKDERKKALGL